MKTAVKFASSYYITVPVVCYEIVIFSVYLDMVSGMEKIYEWDLECQC